MKLNFKKYGGSAEVMVILHGLFGSLDNWHTLATRFGEKFSVYTIDQRNHGRSPHDEEMNYKVMADDLYEFMNDEGIESAHVIGHSMGGKTAMVFASAFPEKVRSLVVADIAPKDYGSGHDVIFEAFKSVDLQNVEKRADAENMIKPLVADFGVRQFLLKNLDRAEDGSYRWKMNLEAIEQNYHIISGELQLKKKIEVPALFIAGGKSGYIKEEDKPAIGEYFPRAKFVVIEDAGHWLHAEKPDEFYDSIIKFIEG